MTSRRLRRIRRESSVQAVLARARRENPERIRQRRDAECMAGVLNDEQISQLLSSGELWPDAACWSPSLLED